MNVLLRVIAGSLGVLLVFWAAISAAVTFVVPRGTPVALTRWVFTAVAMAFRGVALRTSSYRSRDAVMALYGPFALLFLPIAWLFITYWGFTLIYLAVGVSSLHLSLLVSTSSLFTLGSESSTALPVAAARAIEAGLGLGLVAILISYLPSIYSSYSRREVKVTGLETLASSPPFAGTLLERLALVDRLEHTEELWRDWSEWFADIEETHTSVPALVFFRSPLAGRSWVVAAGTILDSASFVASSITSENHPEAQLCIRSGYLSLRRIADYFGLPFDPEPNPTDPISVTREEFDQVFDRLTAAGAPMIDDREAAWRSFSGWRVNYDQVLLELAALTIAPDAPWSSDRAKDPSTFVRLGSRRQRR